MSKPDDDALPSPVPLLHGSLILPDDGQPHEQEIVDKLASSGRILLDRYLVGVSVLMPNGDHALHPLTPYYYAAASAARKHEELSDEFPGCAVLMTSTIIDPDIPGHLDELVEAGDRLRAEMRRLQ